MGMFLRRGPAPKMGTPIGSLDIGATVKFNVASTPWEFLIVHQGLPSDMYDASCDGAWLLMKDIYTRLKWGGSSGDDSYNSSAVDTYLNGTFLSLLDSNIQSAIINASITSGTLSLSRKVFLLGGYEVGFTSSNSRFLPKDGAKLDYFESGGGSSANNKRVAYLNGTATIWWLRSYYKLFGNATPFYVNDLGALVNNGTGTNGIRPAFILPSDFIVTNDMLA